MSLARVWSDFNYETYLRLVCVRDNGELPRDSGLVWVVKTSSG